MMMYEKISIANARNKVAFDVLAYHASSSIEETNKLMVSEWVDIRGTCSVFVPKQCWVRPKSLFRLKIDTHRFLAHND